MARKVEKPIGMETTKRIKSVKFLPPLETKAAQYYMDVRNQKEELRFLHPDLESILGNSNAVFVYQEEVMKFLVEIAGYSKEESDTIRSAIAKKKHEVIMASFERIRESCRKRGWSEEAIETICQQIMAFSRYSFNKSHSAAYGELGYITMYLKHHHPLEWWASMLNLDLKEDKTRKYVSKLGSVVLPPSLRHPSSRFEVRNGKIVAPVSQIKGVGPKMVEELCNKGPFNSLEDFIDRIDHAKINTGAISALIKGRAADDMMDDTIEYYPDRRKKFIEDFKYLRTRSKKRSSSRAINFHEDVYEFDPLQIFLMEKEANKVFNKALLGQADIVAMIKSSFHTEEANIGLYALKETGHAGVPFLMGETPILANIRVAEGLLNRGEKQEIGMILLYEDSQFHEGFSKKSGRPYQKLTVHLSDGYHMLECLDWHGKKALGWPKNSLVYVRGNLKPGWKTPASLEIHEIHRLLQNKQN